MSPAEDAAEPGARVAPGPTGGGGERATLQVIADQASVSLSTVSKVLNGRGGVGEETRARVEALLQENGYLRRGTAHVSTLVELVFGELGTEWSLEVIRGVERVARANGLSIVVTESGDRNQPGADWIDAALERRPAGVVLVISGLPEESRRQLRVRNIPFVIIDPAGDPPPDVPSVGAQNWSGGMQAARHLLDLGHRRIGVVAGPEDMLMARARLSGFRSALEAAGVELPDPYVVTGEFRREAGIFAGIELLSLPEPPSAIFALSDLQALGVYEAARSLGVSIPDELSVVGYDDLPVATWVGPPLTTVRQPTADMAEQAMYLVLHQRDYGEQENLRIDMATELKVRGSTAPPASPQSGE
ncbi:MAG: LacI family DNA-binding transcriptional regulator [Microbacteriaceae bacterium]|nr:LacI family DNA-binding transcriptional regulator [Microbacteriaceae bacterium]MCL2795518.1 LacI family DNA-binding transcriptional regulator [Microbacteriaceae bacterium]